MTTPEIPREADTVDQHLAADPSGLIAAVDHLDRTDLRVALGLVHVTPTNDIDNGIDLARFEAATRGLGDDLVLGVVQYAAKVRTARGTVVTGADTHDLVRSLVRAEELFESVGRMFMRAAAECRDQVGRELVAANGEQDGVPTGTLTVPDGDGHRIKVTPVTRRTADAWDLATISGVVADIAAADVAATTNGDNAQNVGAEAGAHAAVTLLLSVLSSPKPLVREINALRDRLSVEGRTDLAAALEQARTRGALQWTGDTEVKRETGKGATR